MNIDFRGYWENDNGYELTPIVNTDYWEFTAKAKCLTWVCFSGIRIQPDHHFYTDLGSNPKILQIFPSFRPTRFPRAYIMHDSPYKHKGMYIGVQDRRGVTKYDFVNTTQDEDDRLLWHTLKADGAGLAIRLVIYTGVRIGGKYHYGRKINIKSLSRK